MQIDGRDQSLAHAQSMERIDWGFGLSLAASLALAVGAMWCVERRGMASTLCSLKRHASRRK
jgi:hypothetical protein